MAPPKKARPISVTITPSNGRWHGFLNIGTKPDGKPDRLHRSAKMCDHCRVTEDTSCACYRTVETKIRELEDQRAAGITRPKGTPPGAAAFLTRWVESRVDEVAYKTHESYELVVRVYLVPRVRGLRLDQLNNAAKIKIILADVKRDVSAQTARKTLRVLRIALKAAEVEGLVMRNEARLVSQPTLEKVINKVIPLSREEALAVLPVIMTRRNSARWLLGLVHGLRQGECLGLAWHRPEDPRIPSDIDLDAGTFTIREKLQRRKWKHGCADPHACGWAPTPHRPQGHHKAKPCPQPCRTHTRACPPPCPKACTKHAVACPQRWGGGLVKDKPKTRATDRTVIFEPVVLKAFIDHKGQQAKERQEAKQAGLRWVETGLVFTDKLGRAIDQKRDWDEFQSILLEAGLPRARVHALRHSTATFLLAAGVDKRIVQELMGWSQDMSGTYQHVVTAMQRDAIGKLGAFLWSPDSTGPDQPEPDPTDPESATAVLPAPSNVVPFRRRKAV